MKYLFTAIVFILFSFSAASYAEGSTCNLQEEDSLQNIVVVAGKVKSQLRLEPVSSFSKTSLQIENSHIRSIADFAAFAGNLFMPEYGSKMTSSIYIRGIGSRMENPAIGLNIDGMPVLNKNGFDTDLWDIARIDLLRGPQSTLFGRNTIGGVLNINTLSPVNYQGTRIKLGYGSANSYDISASTYQKVSEKVAFSLGGRYGATDGFFRNAFNGNRCDDGRSGAFRGKFIYTPDRRFTLENIVSFTRDVQGGYAYGLYDPATETTAQANYNDICSYRRTLVSDMLKLSWNFGSFTFSSATSWQYLRDCMTLDQDFTPKSMFIMEQAQRENVINQEFLFRSVDEENDSFSWIAGLSAFYKYNHMNAPVTFRKDGITGLILDNINAQIHKVMPMANLVFEDMENLPLVSAFKTPVTSVALFAQTEAEIVDNLKIVAGLRLDYEHTSFDYACHNTIGYMMTPFQKAFTYVDTDLKDKLKDNYFTPIPKLSLIYGFGAGSNVYASVARGFKAGGYNNQMFSDILQNEMMKNLMGAGMGGMGGGAGKPAGDSEAAYDVEDIITYKPEYSWNYELGLHYNSFSGAFGGNAALYYISCTDQQITVFPDGTTTGRMMTNAGKSRSYGLELDAWYYPVNDLRLSASYAYTNAKFTEYNNGQKDFEGNFVPNVPQNMVSADANYTLRNVCALFDNLSFNLSWNGTGKIYWDEENEVSQKFYSLLNASIIFEKRLDGCGFNLELWGKNITDTPYNSYYFVSMNNPFFAKGKPARWGVTLSFDF
ncbi:MAG: TonB-dependent receptor [Bacteroidales bacterium]|nr:TonB-dependent receptor [Bacteroidales bacterium]